MRKPQFLGIVGSALSMLMLLLILLFIYINQTPPFEDEGIMVSFGDMATGGGYDPTPQEAIAEPTTPPPTPSAPTQNDLMTQENEESLALQEQRKEERRKQAAQAELARKQREEESARREAERIARERVLAEERRKQEAIDKANKMGGLFGNNAPAEGMGNTEGSNHEGNPAGKGESGGNSWSLNGRNLMETIAQPSYNSNVEGRVVVSIRVNSSGQVVSAARGLGTTISDASVLNAAIEAAKKTQFSAGTGEVSGSITYNFRLR